LQLVAVKTKTSKRPIKLPAELFSVMKRRNIRQKEEQLAAGTEWKGNPDNLVFTTMIGTPLEPRNVHRQFKSILTKAEVEEVRFHDLRHTCATLLFANKTPGKQVQELLGHSRLSTTMDIYVHTDEGTREDTASRLDSIFGSPTPETEQPQAKTNTAA